MFNFLSYETRSHSWTTNTPLPSENDTIKIIRYLWKRMRNITNSYSWELSWKIPEENLSSKGYLMFGINIFHLFVLWKVEQISAIMYNPNKLTFYRKSRNHDCFKICYSTMQHLNTKLIGNYRVICVKILILGQFIWFLTLQKRYFPQI